MKIVALNLDIQWKNPQENFKIIEAQFENIEADLFLLPEMFTTGFCMETNDIADREDTTLNWMKNFAYQKQAAVCGTVSVKEKGHFYNRCYFVKPEGTVAYYDKRHLFSYSGEDKVYTAGDKRVVVDYLGVKFLLQICYDLRFPVFSRNQGDYDVALYLANWPQQRIEAWQHLLKARAIENQAIVFGVNRTGQDDKGLSYPESTYAYHPSGALISQQEDNLVMLDLDTADLQQFRAKYPFLKDADRFELK